MLITTLLKSIQDGEYTLNDVIDMFNAAKALKLKNSIIDTIAEGVLGNEELNLNDEEEWRKKVRNWRLETPIPLGETGLYFKIHVQNYVERYTIAWAKLSKSRRIENVDNLPRELNRHMVRSKQYPRMVDEIVAASKKAAEETPVVDLTEFDWINEEIKVEPIDVRTAYNLYLDYMEKLNHDTSQQCIMSAVLRGGKLYNEDGTVLPEPLFEVVQRGNYEIPVLHPTLREQVGSIASYFEEHKSDHPFIPPYPREKTLDQEIYLAWIQALVNTYPEILILYFSLIAANPDVNKWLKGEIEEVPVEVDDAGFHPE